MLSMSDVSMGLAAAGRELLVPGVPKAADTASAAHTPTPAPTVNVYTRYRRAPGDKNTARATRLLLREADKMGGLLPCSVQLAP